MDLSKLQTVVWKEGPHFVAQCLNVDVSSFGDTREDALNNLREALGLYFEDAHEIQISAVDQPEVVKLEHQFA